MLRNEIHVFMERLAQIKKLSEKDKVWDIVVVGGGATGLGVAVADIGADKDRTAVRAVEFLLLFEEREVFADRDLRNLEQLGQLHDGYGAVLLQQCQYPVMTLRKAQNSLFAGFIHRSIKNLVL